MANKPARPFLPLAPGPRNKLRQKVRGGGAKPRDSAADHGENLLRQVAAFQRTIDEKVANRPDDLPPLPDDHQVIIEAKRLQPEQVRSLGLTPIEEREEGLLVTVSPDVTLPTLVSKAESYVTERTDSGNPRFGGVIAPIEQIRPAERADKAGEALTDRLAADTFDPNQIIWVDVELAGGQHEMGEQNRQEFYDYLHSFDTDRSPYAEAVVTATGYFLIEADYSLHRVQLPGRAILDLLDDSRANWILSIDLVPEIEARPRPLLASATAALPPLPALPPTAPRVVIIDSGIAAGHPLFTGPAGRTIIGRQLNFLPEEAEPPDLLTDEVAQGHGTAMASIVAYGSLAPLTVEQPIDPAVVWLENAKIMLPARKLVPEAPAEQPALHPAQFPKALLRAIIAAFHETMPQSCKIFNLSAGTVPHPRHTISNWAEEVDNLSAAHDLLFVVAAGNVPPARIGAALTAGQEYPDYLLDPAARLTNPGQAHTALTVGALTAPPIAPPGPLAMTRWLAPDDHPAPFTRSGTLPPNGLVKPDVVDIGGNLTRSELAPSPELAVPVANREFGENGENGTAQPLAFHYGSGLAAARVSHLAGRLQARYPAASANLIRALIVNSADWPAATVRSFGGDGRTALSKEARHSLLRLCGYGQPQPDKALSSNPTCMVFVTEDQFSWTKSDKNSSGRYPAKVSFFAIRLEPDDLFGLPPATQLRVSVTLAYNPPVRKTQRRRYQAVDIRWHLKRRDEASEDFYARWMAEANGEDEADDDDDETKRAAESGPRPKPWPWQLKPVVNPGGRVRRCSLVRDWFDIYAHDLPHHLELVLLAMVAPWRKPPDPLSQPFALVVSIEALDEQVPIYDTVRVQAEAEPATIGQPMESL